MPQTRFCSAIEKPKVAAEMPASTVIGRMNRPRLWRKPMQMEMITPLRTSSRIMARRLEEAIGDLNCASCRSAAGFHKRALRIPRMRDARSDLDHQLADVLVPLHRLMGRLDVVHAEAAVDHRLEPAIRQRLPQVRGAALHALDALLLAARSKGDADQPDALEREQVEVDLAGVGGEPADADHAPAHGQGGEVLRKRRASDAV